MEEEEELMVGPMNGKWFLFFSPISHFVYFSLVGPVQDPNQGHKGAFLVLSKAKIIN